MNKGMEELVGEIAGLFNLAKLFGEPNKMDGYAEKAITCTLSAARDGLELPGEVGRIGSDATGSQVLDWLEEMPSTTGFIALHKEQAK